MIWALRAAALVGRFVDVREWALSDKDKSNSWPLPLVCGWIFTIAWLLVIATFLLGHEHQISNLDKLPPNEFGDFLAGVFAPLAFAWLVVGVLVQRDELSQQLTEFQHSVEQQISHNALIEEQANRTRSQDLSKSIQIDIGAYLRARPEVS